MTVDDLNRGKLAGLAWRYRHLTLPAMITVLFCIRNRIKEEGNWLPVLEKIEQDLPVPDRTSDQRDPMLTDLLDAVEPIYSGARVDKWTNGGTMWCESGQPKPVEATELTATVGKLEVWK